MKFPFSRVLSNLRLAQRLIETGAKIQRRAERDLVSNDIMQAIEMVEWIQANADRIREFIKEGRARGAN